MGSAIHNRITAKQQAIKKGDPVKVRRDDGTELVTVAESDPWHMGGHTWVISVKGISGGFALCRVQPVAGGQA